MPLLLAQILFQLITAAAPQIIAALGKEWDLLTNAVEEGRDLTPEEFDLVEIAALAAGYNLITIVDKRTGPGGDWEDKS